MAYVIYDDFINADSNSLIYKILSRNLTRPDVDALLNAVLNDRNCDEIQSANSSYFLEHIETAVSNYVFNYDFDLDFTVNPDYKCDCDDECDRECYINAVVMSRFKKVVKQFDTDIENDASFDYVLPEHTEEEFLRITDMSYSIARILLYRELGRWAFYHGFYETGATYNSGATILYGLASHKGKIDLDDYISTEMSGRGKKASDVRWEPYREKKKERKNKYLKIMKDKGFSTYTETAAYIKLHIDTDKSPSFNTVCRLLSEADKGNFL
ncbi:MAG: hypothetical protein ABS921_02070 [Psychrobacter alimentarius]